jgi:hypothetical protein
LCGTACTFTNNGLNPSIFLRFKKKIKPKIASLGYENSKTSMSEVSLRQKTLRANAIARKKQLHAMQESLKIIDSLPHRKANGALVWRRLRRNHNAHDLITVCNVFSNGPANTNEVHDLPDRTLWPFESWYINGDIKVKFPMSPHEYSVQHDGAAYGLFDEDGAKMQYAVLNPITHVVSELIPEHRDHPNSDYPSFWRLVVSMFALMTGNSSV